jgi:hypothetical protein
MAADSAIDPKISEPAGGRVFARALKNAMSDVKGIGGLVLALTAAIAGYFALRDVLKVPGYWPEAAVAGFFIAFYSCTCIPRGATNESGSGSTMKGSGAN